MRKSIIISFCSFLMAVTLNITEKSIYPLELKEDVRFAPHFRVVDFLCLDHRGLAADILFIKVLQHSGSLMWKPASFDFDSRWCFRMMDTVTDLDPKYYPAYLFSGMGLIHYFDDVKLARPILEKGMKIFPESWEIPFWIGYDYYIYLEDYETAGKFLWQAAQKPDAPSRFFSLLLSALKKGGAYEKGIIILEMMEKAAEDKGLKKIYRKKLERLKILVRLQRSAEKYRTRFGRFPGRLKELVKEGIISEIPEIGARLGYKWDPEKKRVIIARIKKEET